MEATLPHPTVTMNRSHIYDPVGHCIYCGASGPEDLSKEHIVSLGLGGALELRKSSCSTCRKKTGAVEEHVLRIMFGNVRAQLGIKTRRPKERPTHTKLTRNHGPHAETIANVPLTELPPIIIMPRWLPAGNLMDKSPFEERWGTGISIVYPDKNISAMQRMKDLSYLGRLHLFKKPVQIIEFIRMLAKIAHSYVTAELWPNKFTPCLTNIILQREHPITPFGTFKPTFYAGGSFLDEAAGG